MILKNKKAGEKLLTIWWFIVLGVIGGAIGIGIMIYFSATVNTNSVEAGILGERIINCISENGYLKNNVLNKDTEKNDFSVSPNLERFRDFDIFKECGIDRRLFERGSYLYFNVSISSGGIVLANFIAGDYSLERDCSIASKISASHFAKCDEKSETLFNDKNEIIKIHVLTGSNQQGGRVAAV